MKKLNRQNCLSTLLLFVVLIALSGCPKKTEVSSAPEAPAPAAQKAEAAKDSGPQAPGAASSQEAVPAQKDTAGMSAEGLMPIYFEFDRSFIRDDAKAVMKANADWLKVHPKVKIKIEGNCDERGTKEYNQALGQRRAASAKKYLTDLGISGKRISLISFGKEKPVCPESTEHCWQKNRRDDFIPQE